MSNTAVYATMQQMLFEKLTLNGGIRYEMNATYGNELIPQFGVSWNPIPETSLKASVSKGYRPPSIRELYLFPPANDLLEPERMLNCEIGWNQQWWKGKIKSELTLFMSRGENMIVLVPPSAPPPPQYRNSGQFNNKGIEFSINYEPLEDLRLHANYTYLNMKSPLPASPGHNLFLSGRYRYGKWNFLLKLQNIFHLYGAVVGEIAVVEKRYHVLGARIAYRAGKFMEIFVTGHNLLNQDYQINYGYPMPGTAFMGGLNLKFSTHH
jgi:iron complex outermembrane receptor protein